MIALEGVWCCHRQIVTSLVRDREVDCADLIAAYSYRFSPHSRLRKHWALDAALGENVVGVLLAKQIPALMPSHDLIRARRDVGQLEAPALVRYGIVGVQDHHHLGIHPDVAN